ncbi:glycosyltransferase [Roseivirga sp.]|uniref:glycosyltransferase n=1 Tax=Roseivirga sp. TaxID=1964215 RepID=UPI003B8D5D37
MNTIICHSFPAWDTPYVKSTLELMTRLTGENRVILVDYHYTWKDVFLNDHAPKKRLLGFKSRWRKIETKNGVIEIYNSSPVLPTNWVNNKKLLNLFTQVNRWILKRSIRSIMKRTVSDKTTLINAFNPVFGLLTQKFWKVNKTYYYCYDEISGTSWAGKHGPEYEAEYIKNVDGVICTSHHLKEEKSRLNPNCHLVPNGVNLDIFKTVAPNKNRNYTLGYAGAVDNRLDFNLIGLLAEELDTYHFHFFGPIKTALPKLPTNVHFHGAVSQKSLPEKLNMLDACLIPFVKNELTKGIYPLKINEYLALGKPVISTDFANLSDFDKLISIATSNADFVTMTKKEIRYNNRLKGQKRIDFAQKNSWSDRANQFNEVIHQSA